MASPPVSPRVAAASTIKMAIRWLPVRKPWNRPWKISHSLTNPFSGGSAAIPSVPANVITVLRGLAVGVEDHSGAERGHDDPGVLDRGVGQEPLDVAFPQRVQDADGGGDRT